MTHQVGPALPFTRSRPLSQSNSAINPPRPPRHVPLYTTVEMREARAPSNVRERALTRGNWLITLIRSQPQLRMIMPSPQHIPSPSQMARAPDLTS